MDNQRYFSNRELDAENVTSPDAELAAIGRFADSFDLVTHPRVLEFTGQAGQELLGRCIKDYQDHQILPDSMSELRACLALEWAILPYVAPEGPNPDQERFLRDLVRRIRALVLSGQID
jgi:hypothetical protein